MEAIFGLEEALGEARVLVVTCELNEHTLGLVDKTRLGLLAPDCYVINVSRGPVVCEEALVEALSSGKVRGAGLDVFEQEPLPTMSKLRDFPYQTILGTHNGSNTYESVDAASARAIDFLTQ